MQGLVLVCVFLAAAAAILFVRLASVRRAADELRGQLAEILGCGDTNALLTLSTSDQSMRQLAADLNGQLRLLRAQRQRYQQGDAELKEAVTSISHDLRTPLTSICGYLDLLDAEELPPQARRYAGLIRSRADAMKQLTEELFRYSVVTAETGMPGSLSAEQLSLNAVLEESLAACYTLLTQRRILPRVTLPERPVMRCLNRAALARIFGNILSNAAKYSEGDLQVTLSGDGTIRFTNSTRALSAVTAGKLFDRFYTVEHGRNATGLGLSIAKLLTEQMGGTICAEYAEGQLTIVVCFPRPAAEPQLESSFAG